MKRRKNKDSRTPEEREIDERYNDMIVRQLGEAALDVPMRDYVESGFGGVIVVPDPADLGFHYALPLSPEEQGRAVEMALEAVAESYRQMPLTSDGD